MDVHAGTDWIRARARDARESSVSLCEESLELRLVAAALRGRRGPRQESRRQRASRRLEWRTEALDAGVLEWAAIGRFLESDSRAVGRDPAIEEAKTILCERYGVGRGEAFEMLRHVSSQTNRKLRDVARGVVGEPAGRDGPEARA